MSLGKVLVVEDEFLIRLTLGEALTDDGFEVVQAGNSDEAMATLHADGPFALLLTDVQLPGSMDGVALARAARKTAPDLPVIFMTGRPDSVDRAASSDHSVFIAKPYLPSQVCAAARRLLVPMPHRSARTPGNDAGPALFIPG